MDRRTRERGLGLAIVVASVAGVAFIIFGDVILTTAGILLVILSAVGFLVVVKDFIVGQESDVSDLPKGESHEQ
jgi:drug/metabolite transporter (DMT)-like permease